MRQGLFKWACGPLGLALVLVFTLSAAALAQTTLGRVAGTVLDQSGGVLPGATVTLDQRRHRRR